MVERAFWKRMNPVLQHDGNTNKMSDVLDVLLIFYHHYNNFKLEIKDEFHGTNPAQEAKLNVNEISTWTNNEVMKS